MRTLAISLLLLAIPGSAFAGNLNTAPTLGRHILARLPYGPASVAKRAVIKALLEKQVSSGGVAISKAKLPAFLGGPKMSAKATLVGVSRASNGLFGSGKYTSYLFDVTAELERNAYRASNPTLTKSVTVTTNGARSWVNSTRE